MDIGDIDKAKQKLKDLGLGSVMDTARKILEDWKDKNKDK